MSHPKTTRHPGATGADDARPGQGNAKGKAHATEPGFWVTIKHEDGSWRHLFLRGVRGRESKAQRAANDQAIHQGAGGGTHGRKVLAEHRAGTHAAPRQSPQQRDHASKLDFLSGGQVTGKHKAVVASKTAKPKGPTLREQAAEHRASKGTREQRAFALSFKAQARVNKLINQEHTTTPVPGYYKASVNKQRAIGLSKLKAGQEVASARAVRLGNLARVFTPKPAPRRSLPERVTVHADTAKLHESLAKDRGYYVGPGGTGAAKPGAYANVKAHAASGKKADHPKVGLHAGEAHVDDGRHRLALAAEQGHKTIAVSVPRESAAEFHRKFGAAPASQPRAAGAAFRTQAEGAKARHRAAKGTPRERARKAESLWEQRRVEREALAAGTEMGEHGSKRVYLDKLREHIGAERDVFARVTHRLARRGKASVMRLDNPVEARQHENYPTPSGEERHIGYFGGRPSGTSSPFKARQAAARATPTLHEQVAAHTAPVLLRERTRQRLESAKAIKGMPTETRRAIAANYRSLRGGKPTHAVLPPPKPPPPPAHLGHGPGSFNNAVKLAKAHGIEVQYGDLNGVAAQYYDRQNTIVIDKGAFQAADRLERSRMAGESGYFSSSHPDSTIHHEIGHALHHRNVGPQAMYQRLTQYFDPETKAALARSVSTYGASNKGEFVAEVYAGMASGKQYDHGIVKLYKELGGAVPNAHTVATHAPAPKSLREQAAEHRASKGTAPERRLSRASGIREQRRENIQRGNELVSLYNRQARGAPGNRVGILKSIIQGERPAAAKHAARQIARIDSEAYQGAAGKTTSGARARERDFIFRPSTAAKHKTIRQQVAVKRAALGLDFYGRSKKATEIRAARKQS